MKIIFEQDGNTVYAISQNQILEDHVYEELMWAEIIIPKGIREYTVRWEDNYLSSSFFATLEDAKLHIERAWPNHKPFINGGSAKIDD